MCGWRGLVARECDLADLVEISVKFQKLLDAIAYASSETPLKNCPVIVINIFYPEKASV